jgi:hypothetical protein
MSDGDITTGGRLTSPKAANKVRRCADFGEGYRDGHRIYGDS